jgi:hypothetical protein
MIKLQFFASGTERKALVLNMHAERYCSHAQLAAGSAGVDAREEASINSGRLRGAAMCARRRCSTES